MRTTHRHNSPLDAFEVTAWQFSHTRPIPVWVARKFHRVGGKGWTSLAMDGVLVEAYEGDWAVCLEGEVAVVLHDHEFKNLFVPIP